MRADTAKPIRVSLAQINARVGDIPANMAAIVAEAREAAHAGADIVVFPEMALTGYPIEDLAVRASYVDASNLALDEAVALMAENGFGHLVAIVGFLDQDPATGRPLNSAAVLHEGQVVRRYAKTQLPNYGVFDEYRTFSAGHDPCTINIAGLRITLLICEDLWVDSEIIASLAADTRDLVVVINGSPFVRGKTHTREELAARRARELRAPLAYVNLVGGQDDLVFDGGSFVVDAAGEVVGKAEQFVAARLNVDVTAARDGLPATVNRPGMTRPLDRHEEMYRAVVLGLQDYVRKNGFASVILGLSGGIDSALVAAMAADAIGGTNVVGVSMPSEFSSDHSKSDAQDLAQRIGADYRIAPITNLAAAFLSELPLTGVAAENIQARLRGMTLMAISNMEGHLVLATGNKSELATGYSTIYGDAVGGFAPLKDVLKTEVWALARWRNSAAIDTGQIPPIPDSSITKPPSAELRPGQVDQDLLPDYFTLDAVLTAYVEDGVGRAGLLAQGFDAGAVDRVLSLVDGAEWKRRQYPPGPKVSPLAFGRDRRLPITNLWQELEGAT